MSTNEPLTSFHSLSFMKNGQNLSQFLLRPSMKFGSKLQKFFIAKNFFFDQILFCFVLFTTKIFCSTCISQLPNNAILPKSKQSRENKLTALHCRSWLSSSFRCDQIHKGQKYYFGHTLMCYLDWT